MKTEQEIKMLLGAQQELIVTHKKECQICPVASHECKTNIVINDRLNLLKLILA